MGLTYIHRIKQKRQRALGQVGNPKNIIELNGKRYDAVTGRQLTPSTPSAKTAPRQIRASVDGFATPRPISATTTAPKPQPKTRSKVAAKSVHKKAQHSTTLLRKAVTKPKSTPITPKNIVTSRSVDPVRIKRSQEVAKSNKIQRFNFSDFGQNVKKQTASLTAKAAPVLQTPITFPGKKISTDQQKLNSLEKSLKSAHSHELTKLKKQKLSHRAAKKLHLKPRTLSLAITAFILIVAISYTCYLNMARITIKYASARAGISAHLPEYQPAGFALDGPISYQKGQIRIAYKSNSDSRNYTVTQTSSNWDSASLLQNYIASNNYTYQTFQDNGRTIYLYNGNNATWVDGGVWYQVEGNNVLSSDQLVHIATSI